MESHHYNGGGMMRSSGFLSRQASTRWVPSAEQMRILRDLYYVNRLRSPTAEQIRRITDRLRQYGKLEEKNVFYWFQNHKARDRHLKRKLTTFRINNNNTTDHFTNKTTINQLPDAAASRGKMTSWCGYGGGSIFRECCLSAGDLSMVESNNMGCVHHGLEPTNCNIPCMNQYMKEEGSITATQEIQTLQLFPTNSQEQQEEQQEREEILKDNNYGTLTLHDPSSCSYYSQNQHQQEDYHHCHCNNIGAASLELTLNYYCPGSI